MGEREFWRLHPAEFIALYARHYHAQIAAEFGTAQLAALYFNAHKPADEEVRPVGEFMIHKPPKPKKADAAMASFAAHANSRKARLQAKGIAVK